MINAKPINLQNNINVINKNISQVCGIIGKDASEILVMAVAKNTEVERVNVAINGGIRYIGENRVQEFLDKYSSYAVDKNRIHFIGHLQTNKVKYIIDKVSMIESVDSFRLASEIDKLAKKQNIIMDILLEINIANESTKSGFDKDEVISVLPDLARLENVNIKGLMCVPPKLECETALSEMDKLFKKIKSLEFEKVTMQYLSTGMSQCYEQAILNGANIIRLGSALFK